MLTIVFNIDCNVWAGGNASKRVWASVYSFFLALTGRHKVAGGEIRPKIERFLASLNSVHHSVLEHNITSASFFEPSVVFGC